MYEPGISRTCRVVYFLQIYGGVVIIDLCVRFVIERGWEKSFLCQVGVVFAQTGSSGYL